MPFDTETSVLSALEALGISLESIRGRGLRPCPEARQLEVVEVARNGREHRLVPKAAAAWRRMKESAAEDGEALLIVSAFRSIAHQVDIIRGRLETGARIDDILKSCAPPGFSEHHTGCAVDVGTHSAPGVKFDQTSAFRWLLQHGERFGFTLSYPAGNPWYQYEPWHWCHTASMQGSVVAEGVGGQPAA